MDYFKIEQPTPLKIPIVAILMVKNEETNIERTIRSCVGFDGVYIFDTGSTDATIDVAVKTCKSMGLKHNVLQGTFVNFYISRNTLIDHVAKDKSLFGDVLKWMILFDANDELQGSKSLRKFLSKVGEYMNIVDQKSGNVVKVATDAIYLRQRWQNTPGSFMNFKNQRCLRSDTPVRFEYVVHEVVVNQLNKEALIGKDTAGRSKTDASTVILMNKNKEMYARIPLYAPDDIIMYQDRALDTTMSSQRRWARDKKMLQREYDALGPGKRDPRYIFYLAQTCKCLDLIDASIAYYTERFHIKSGFTEEIYVSAYEIGCMTIGKIRDYMLSHPDEMSTLNTVTNSTNKIVDLTFTTVGTYIRDMTYFLLEAERLDARVEPLVQLGSWFLQHKFAVLALMCGLHAESLPLPNVLLWYTEENYTHTRYRLTALACLNLGLRSRGLESAKKAFAVSKSRDDIVVINALNALLKPREDGYVYLDDVEKTEKCHSKIQNVNESFYNSVKEYVSKLLDDFKTPFNNVEKEKNSDRRNRFEKFVAQRIEMWRKIQFILIELMKLNEMDTFPLKTLHEFHEQRHETEMSKMYGRMLSIIPDTVCTFSVHL